MTRPTPSMILTPVQPGGWVEDQGYGTPMWLHSDARVPTPLPEHETHLVAAYLKSEHCPDGRHLWDILESVDEREVQRGPVEDGEWNLEHRFRARLTCVRCGVIRHWEGTRDGDARDPGQVDPVPLVIGDLAAQMVKSDGTFRQDMSTWVVHRGDERVGVITWGCGPRGRAYYAGHLFHWPTGESVEAPTPIAVLRKLSRAAARAPEAVGASA